MLVLGGLLNAAAAVVQFYGIDSLVRFHGRQPGRDPRRRVWQFRPEQPFRRLCHPRADFRALPADQRAAELADDRGLRRNLSLRAVAFGFAQPPGFICWRRWRSASGFAPRSDDAALRRAAVVLAVLLPLFGAGAIRDGPLRSGHPAGAAGGAAYAPVTPIDRFVEELAHGLLPQTGGSALGTRLYMWHQALLMWSRAPLLGVGFGQYAGVFFEQAAELSRYHIPNYDRNAHNALMQLLAETGLVGAGLVCAGLGAWLWGLRRRLARDRRNLVDAVPAVGAVHAQHDRVSPVARQLPRCRRDPARHGQRARPAPASVGLVALCLSGDGDGRVFSRWAACCTPTATWNC